MRTAHSVSCALCICLSTGVVGVVARASTCASRRQAAQQTIGEQNICARCGIDKSVLVMLHEHENISHCRKASLGMLLFNHCLLSDHAPWVLRSGWACPECPSTGCRSPAQQGLSELTCPPQAGTPAQHGARYLIICMPVTASSLVPLRSIPHEIASTHCTEHGMPPPMSTDHYSCA